MNGDLTGARFILTSDVERYPHFIAPAGSKGTITTFAPDEINGEIGLRLDEHLPGAEEWDNEVCWYRHDQSNYMDIERFYADARPLLSGDIAR
jgi:hypothetical protein